MDGIGDKYFEHRCDMNAKLLLASLDAELPTEERQMKRGRRIIMAYRSAHLPYKSVRPSLHKTRY